MRPLTLGDIYDGAIRAMRFNPKVMVGFSSLVIAVMTLITTFPQAAATWTFTENPIFDPDAGSPTAAEVGSAFAGLAATVAVPAVIGAIVTTVVTALLIRCVESAVRGERITTGQLWKLVARRTPAVLGLSLLPALVMPVLIALLTGPGFVVLALVDSPVPGVVLLVIGGVAAVAVILGLTMGWWAMAAPALLLEELGVFAALARSARLVRGNFWRVLGIGLLTALLTGVIGGFLSLPTSLLGAGVSFAVGDDGSYLELLLVTAVGNIGQVLAGAVVYPFSAGVTALLYLDLRMRREGLDVLLLSRR